MAGDTTASGGRLAARPLSRSPAPNYMGPCALAGRPATRGYAPTRGAAHSAAPPVPGRAGPVPPRTNWGRPPLRPGGTAPLPAPHCDGRDGPPRPARHPPHPGLSPGPAPGSWGGPPRPWVTGTVTP